MKIKLQSKAQGNAMISALLTATIIGITLASYLTLVSSQNVSVMRSLAWNSSVAVAEAGIEEALTQLYQNGITNLAANHWALGKDGYYHKNRSVGADGSYFEVAIIPVERPVIVATGHVPAPLASGSQLGMILGNLVTPSPTSTSIVKRRIRVTTTTAKGSPLNAAVVARGPIYLTGSGVTVDSFDSSDPAHDNPLDPREVKDNGHVLSNGGDGLTSNGKPRYAIEVGEADIKGKVNTAPGGTVYVDLVKGGSVGDNAWVNAGTPGVKPGWESHDANLEIPDAELPFTSGLWPVGATIGKVKYTYLLAQSADYVLKKPSTFGGKVLVTGNARLWVEGDVNFGSGDFLEIAPGASLKLYVSGLSAIIGGQGVVNYNNNASSFQYFGLPTNTSLDLKGNSAFTGTVYAPQADMKLGGGGADTYDFIGAVVVNTLFMNGHYHIHYDETVKLIPAQGDTYIVDSWNEVDPAARLNEYLH